MTARKANLAHGTVFALSLLSALLLAAPAGASGPHGPRYTLQVDEGATTLPEYEHPDSAWASLEGSPHTEIFLSLIHAGLVVEVGHGHDESDSASVSGPQVGDELLLEAPKGTVIARVTYDGLPTIDPTVCAGSTNFSGENTSGYVVEGNYSLNVLETPYHQGTRPVRKAYGEAQVKTLSGTTFGGDFLQPLAIGEDVTAVESLKTPLAGEATYTYISETERPVGACPTPPPPDIPPAPPVLDGSIIKKLSTTIHKFLRFGARDEVTINQPGTVIQDLYLKGGTLPAYASATHHHGKPEPALLLARGSASSKAAGTVTVLLKPTAKGRRKLKSMRSANVVLITTLRSSSGAKISLARRSITLHR